MSPENVKLEAVSLGRHGERVRMEMEFRRNQWKQQHPDYGNDDDVDDKNKRQNHHRREERRKRRRYERQRTKRENFANFHAMLGFSPLIQIKRKRRGELGKNDDDREEEIERSAFYIQYIHLYNTTTYSTVNFIKTI